MVRNGLIILVTVLFIQQPLTAQVRAKILAVQGEVKLQNGMNVRTALPGMNVSEHESLVLDGAAYVSIVHRSGETREIRGRGQYPVKDLFDNGSSDVGGIKTMMYADYVLSRMTPEGKKNRLGATGYHVKTSVSGQPAIHMHIPSTGKFYNHQPLLSWDGDNSSLYRVEILTMFREVLQVRETKKNQLRINLDEPGLEDQKTVLVKVISENGESEYYALRRMTDDQFAEISQELSGMKGLATGSTPADKFMLAGIFEYHNLLTDALACYLESMQQAPDVHAYREAYEEFLLRNHLIRF